MYSCQAVIDASILNFFPAFFFSFWRWYYLFIWMQGMIWLLLILDILIKWGLNWPLLNNTLSMKGIYYQERCILQRRSQNLGIMQSQIPNQTIPTCYFFFRQWISPPLPPFISTSCQLTKINIKNSGCDRVEWWCAATIYCHFVVNISCCTCVIYYYFLCSIDGRVHFPLIFECCSQ